MSGNQRIYADKAALAEYSSRAGSLADDVRGTAAATLANNRSIPEDCFGDVGREVGVHSALSSHISDLHDHVQRTASAVDGLGSAVTTARTDYEYDEQDKADRFKGLEG
jgi:hypothetical protein